MNLIVNVDKNWAIGHQNKLLVSIPADMRYFRELTTGKVIILGRKTLETFPGGKPLKNRTNIVITSKSCEIEDAVVVHSLEEALAETEKYPSEEVFVVGGASVYEQFLPYCDRAYVTRTDFSYQADTWFPNLDKLPDWELTGESEEQTYYDLEYYFCKYERKTS
ncbi:dihydrofolate reductase [Acetivibrio ethanolgignens]|uniref:Dihydrofolate reductase n=1 Tax=Acetivibrio ethanolgignens TaxID=290052 RepID=A0A0V8QE18_9FIRM|nr:dihydrofolate reductase [Acetivibrio ethanolgignens]KSV58486.1 diacylglycerol kinase [Acetivibrio ethanolgignens]